MAQKSAQVQDDQAEKISLEDLVNSGQGDTKVSLGVAMPAELKLAITQHAKAANSSARRVALEILAREFQVAIPDTLKAAPGTGGRTEEEKKAARKAKSSERRELIKALLAKHKAEQTAADGDEDEDEDEDSDEE